MFQRFRLELSPKLKINVVLEKHTILLGIESTNVVHLALRKV